MYFSFQHEITEKLWEAISKNYEVENYSGAILDSIYLLSKTIREKTDIELDGIPLIGKVFGGINPILKINNFRTESEINEQKGIENILRGLFQAIRNPRAHEKIEDNKKTCDSIIIFIDFLLDLIEGSKSIFEIDDFCLRIFDSAFVESNEYADLLVKDVPQKKIFDVLIKIFNRRELAEPRKFSYVIHAFIKIISAEQYKEFLKIISAILKSSNNEHDFCLIIKLFQGKDWSTLELSAKLRAENKLIKSFEEGIYDSKKNRCNSGALGTWLSNIIEYLEMKKQFRYSLIKKISSDNYEEIEYIMKYFRNSILAFDEQPEYSLINAINKGLKKGDKRFYDLVSVEFLNPESKWLKEIQNNYDTFEEKDLYPYLDEDNLPFCRGS